MTQALEPCPFCGCEAAFDEVTDQSSPDFGGHFIHCTRCLGSLGLKFALKDDPRPLLADDWNCRSPSDAARREALMGIRKELSSWGMVSAVEIVDEALAALDKDKETKAATEAPCTHQWSEWQQVGRHVERKCAKCGAEQYDD